MAPDTLDQAVQYIRTGNKQAALPLLKQVLQSEPKNESAWFCLYSCVDDISQKKYCLQKVLGINPANASARSGLEQLNALDLPIPVQVTPDQPAPVPQKNIPVQTPPAARPAPVASAAAPVHPPTAPRPAGSSRSSGEITYYQKDPVIVTSHRVVFGGNTHVLRNINSVGMVKLPPRRSTGRIIAGVSFLIMMCLGLSTIGKTETSTLLFLFEATAFMGIVLGLVLSFLAKPHYAVRLVSGSGELNGYISKDQQEVAAIIDSINRAVVERS